VNGTSARLRASFCARRTGLGPRGGYTGRHGPPAACSVAAIVQGEPTVVQPCRRGAPPPHETRRRRLNVLSVRP
jgi:hypothetical protein